MANMEAAASTAQEANEDDSANENNNNPYSLISVIAIFVVCTTGLILFQSITAGSIFSSSSSTSSDTKSTTITTKLHLRRRIQHALTGLILIGLSYIIPSPYRTYMLLLASTLFYIFHRLRSSHPSIQQIYIQSFGSLLRPHEKRPCHPPGALYFLIGTTVASGCFGEDVGRMAVLCLSLADPMAAIVGTIVGGPTVIPSSFLAFARRKEKEQKRKGNEDDENGGNGIFKKTWTGSITCFMVAFCIAHVTLKGTTASSSCSSTSWSCATVAGISCAFAEFMSDLHPSLDDNLIIPIVTGGAVTLFNSN